MLRPELPAVLVIENTSRDRDTAKARRAVEVLRRRVAHAQLIRDAADPYDCIHSMRAQ